MIHVWQWFNDLNGARGQGWAGPSPLSFSDIAAWSWLSRETMKPWEFRAIIEMDRRLLGEGAKSAETTKATNERPMSPNLFDAMFGK